MFNRLKRIDADDNHFVKKLKHITLCSFKIDLLFTKLTIGCLTYGADGDPVPKMIARCCII